MISLAISETKLCRAGSSDPAISPEARRGQATPPYNSNCMDPARTVLWTSRSTQLHASAQVQIGGCEQLPVFAPGRWRSWRPWGSGEPITNGRFRQARRAAPVTNATEQVRGRSRSSSSQSAVTASRAETPGLGSAMAVFWSQAATSQSAATPQAWRPRSPSRRTVRG